MSSEDKSPNERMDDEIAGSDSMSSPAQGSSLVMLDLGIGTGSISNSDDEFVKERKFSQNTTPDSTATPTMVNKKVLVNKKPRLTKTKSSLVSYGQDSDEELSDDDTDEIDDSKNSDDHETNSNHSAPSQSNVETDPMQTDLNAFHDKIGATSELLTGVTLTTSEASPVSRGDLTPIHQLIFPEDADIRIPPLTTKHCPANVEKKFKEFYERLKITGIDQNARIQALKDFRNPSLYEKMISHLGIDEIGTNFPQELYDPHLWGPDSHYEALSQAQKSEMDKREKERRERTKIGFTPGVKSQIGLGPSIVSEPVVEKRKNRFDQ